MPGTNPQDPPKTKSEALDRIREAIQNYARAADFEENGGGGNLVLIDFIFAGVSINPATSDREATYTYDGTGMAHTNIGLGRMFLAWAGEDGFEDDE